MEVFLRPPWRYKLSNPTQQHEFAASIKHRTRSGHLKHVPLASSPPKHNITHLAHLARKATHDVAKGKGKHARLGDSISFRLRRARNSGAERRLKILRANAVKQQMFGIPTTASFIMDGGDGSGSACLISMMHNIKKIVLNSEVKDVHAEDGSSSSEKGKGKTLGESGLEKKKKAPAAVITAIKVEYAKVVVCKKKKGAKKEAKEEAKKIARKDETSALGESANQGFRRPGGAGRERLAKRRLKMIKARREKHAKLLKERQEKRMKVVKQLISKSNLRKKNNLPSSYSGTRCSTKKIILSMGLCKGHTSAGYNQDGSRKEVYQCVYKGDAFRKDLPAALSSWHEAQVLKKAQQRKKAWKAKHRARKGRGKGKGRGRRHGGRRLLEAWFKRGRGRRHPSVPKKKKNTLDDLVFSSALQEAAFLPEVEFMSAMGV